MGSNAAQRTKFLPAANTNVLIDRLDDVDESGDFVMNLILRDSVLAMQACPRRMGVGFGERRAQVACDRCVAICLGAHRAVAIRGPGGAGVVDRGNRIAVSHRSVVAIPWVFPCPEVFNTRAD